MPAPVDPDTLKALLLAAHAAGDPDAAADIADPAKLAALLGDQEPPAEPGDDAGAT